MAGMTQKELNKPYFHCGPFWKGNLENGLKILKKERKKKKSINRTNKENNILTIYIYINYCLLHDFLKKLFFTLCLNAFREVDVFKEWSKLFHKEGPT